MEQSHSSKSHCYSVFITAIDNYVISYRSTRFSYIIHSALSGSFNIVVKREESVAGKRNPSDSFEIIFLFVWCKRFGFYSKKLFPVFKKFFTVNVRYVLVYNIIPIGSAYFSFERKIENLIMLSEMPYIGLISRKTSTMYSGLLSCAYSYSLSVNCVAYRV